MKWLLFPFSLLYGFIVYFRNKLFDYDFLKNKEFDPPIISVGNITVGGTGKTPHIEYLISLMKDKFKVATLSRGYKRKTRGFREVSLSSSVDEVGDEPLQLKKKFPDINVLVDANRVRGVERILSDDVSEQINVILLDDAYQHRYIKPGLSILLIDFNRPISKDYLLPYGRLREQAYEKRRANIILITKSPREIKPIERRIIVKNLKLFPYQTLYFTTFDYGQLVPVFPDGKIVSNDILDSENISILLITGVAYPKILSDYLRDKQKDVTHLNYPDHYVYKQKDILKIEDTFKAIKPESKIIITTEKDAVRLREFDHSEIQQPVQ